MKTEPDKSPLYDESIQELGFFTPRAEVSPRLGSRYSVGQALSLLVNRGTILGVGRGFYGAPVARKTRQPKCWKRLCSVSLDNFSCYQLFVRTAQHSAVT